MSEPQYLDPPGDPGPPNFGINLPVNSGFTVEGEIEREVAIFAGARNAHGWRKWVVYTGALILVVFAAASVAATFA